MSHIILGSKSPHPESHQAFAIKHSWQLSVWFTHTQTHMISIVICLYSMRAQKRKQFKPKFPFIENQKSSALSNWPLETRSFKNSYEHETNARVARVCAQPPPGICMCKWTHGKKCAWINHVPVKLSQIKRINVITVEKLIQITHDCFI